MAGNLSSYLRQSRQRTLDRSPSANAFVNKFYSGTNYALWRAAGALTSELSKGLVLDAGSGRGAWKDIIEHRATRESVDIAPKAAEQVTWIADITSMPQVPSGRYDVAICHQVLEHVQHPAAAIAELWRILRPGGKLLISVPHLSRQHELPHDYFRFTPGGLKILLSEAGFSSISVTKYGGILTFTHHQFSTLLLEAAAVLYPVQLMCAAINAPLSILSASIDRIIDPRGLLANGVVAVAEKQAEEKLDV